MAVFQSKYRELSFYVNGSVRSFDGGSYTTEDADEIAVLESLVDVERVDKEKPEEAEVKAAEKAAPKPPARRKPSAQ